MKKIIQVKNLSYEYSSHRVLDTVEVDIHPGTFTMILGRNGSGKSTFLRLLSGILPYHGGSIQVMDRELNKMGAAEQARIIGYLGQSHKAVFPFRVEDVVLTGRAGYVRFIPGETDREIVDKTLKRVGISHLIDRIYTELSGGEQQLVMIARALAQEPSILLLDEPTGHLDFSNQTAVLSLLKGLVNEGLSIAAVLHDPNMAFLFGDDFLFVHEKKVFRDTCRKAWESPLLKKIYFGHLKSIPYDGRAFLVPDISIPV